MTKRSFPAFASLLLFLVVLIGGSLPAKPALAQSADKKPNIVFVLMDNLGYGEVGVYGDGILRAARAGIQGRGDAAVSEVKVAAA